MLLLHLYQQSIVALTKTNFISNPTLEAKILVKFVLNLTDTTFTKVSNNLVLTDYQEQQLQQLINRRLQGEPIAYLIGYKNFWKSSFIVNKDVLIPRPASETLIEAILQEVKYQEEMKILELGIGSGCILFSLLQEYPKAKGMGVDISKKALEVAKANAIALGIKNYTLKQSNLFQQVQQKFHIIISNPPYIAFNDNHIATETKNFEPPIALYAKDNGLFFYKEILQQANNYLLPQGKIFLEIGFNQKDSIIKLLQVYGYSNYKFFKDLAGIDRVVAISY